MEDPLGALNTVVVASATTIIFFACLPIQLAALTKFTGFFFMFTTSLACKSEPEVVFFSHFQQRVANPPPSHAKASRRWSSFHVFDNVSPPPLPSHAKASWNMFFFMFRPHVTTSTSIACKSEPEVVVFLCFICMSPPPPPSHAKASQRWFFSCVSSTCHHHHLPRMQKRAGGGVSSPPLPRHHLRRPYPHTKHPTRRIGG